MAGENPEENDAVSRHIDNLRDGGIRVVVTDEEVPTGFDPHPGRGVLDTRVGQSISINSMEIDPELPLICRGHRTIVPNRTG